jgi:protease-4
MSAESDYLVDRRRMRRKVTFWRAAAFTVAALAVIGAGVAWGSRRGALTATSHIARVEISGLITGDRKTLDLLKSLERSTTARGVIVSINSPGGTVTGSEALFDGLRELSAKKPTVAVVKGMAASGAYIAAMGTEHIVAQSQSLVGSIGVLFQYPNVVKLLDNVGVKMETVKSSPLKAAPNTFEPPTPQSEAAVQALVTDSFAWFKGLVGERRGIGGQQLATVSDGRVFTGHQGVDLKLVDEVGNEKQAIAWLEKAKGVPADLRVRDWKPRNESPFGLWSVASGAARLAGLEDLAAALSALSRSADQPMLDGLLAVWHP